MPAHACPAPAACRLALEGIVTYPGAGATLPDIQPGALPALQELKIAMPQLQATLPASWGASPGVLPSLRTLKLKLHVVGQLPPEWASGFQRLESLVLSDPQCTPGSLEQASTARTEPQAQAASAARSKSASRRSVATEEPAASPSMGPQEPAGFCSPMMLPPQWARAGSFPRLTGLWLMGLRLSGTIPHTWLQPGGLPSITVL